MDDLLTGPLLVPMLSALFGGVASYLGAHQAMRIELAVLRTRIEALERADGDHTDNLNDAHRRIDALLHRGK